MEEILCRNDVLEKLKNEIAIRKSLNEFPGNVAKLEYFKRELLKILDTQEEKTVTKNIDFINYLYIKKANFGVGHVSTYKDGSMWRKTQANPPRWKCIRQAKNFLSETSGARQSITKLKNKVRGCKSTDELLDIVMFNFSRFTDENGQLLPIVEELKSEVDIKKVNMIGETKLCYDNLMSFVNEKNFNSNKKLTREQIFEKYDNKPKKIAKLPPLMQQFFNGFGNGFINCGKAYMIDHVVHNHPATPLPLYRRIQYILNRASEFYYDTETGSIAVYEQYGEKKRKPVKNMLIFKKDDSGNLVLHKTFYDTTKKLPAKFKKYTLADIQQGLTLERVEHTLIGRSGVNPAPASGSVSGRSSNSNIPGNGGDVKDLNSVDEVRAFYKGTGFTGGQIPENKRKENLQNQNAVKIRTDDFKGISDSEIRNLAKDKYKQLKPIQKDGINIEFPVSGYKETKQHSADKNVMYVLGQLDEIMKNAVFMYKEPNSDPKKEQTLNMLNYAAKVEINGEEYYTRIVIREDVNGNYYYDNDSTSIEKVKANLEFLSAPNAGAHQSSPYIDRISQWLAGVKFDVNNKHDKGKPVASGEKSGNGGDVKEFNSIDEVRAFYKGTDKWLKAPNGKDTNLTEKQWCEVRTKNFKNWFGDWEKAAEINSVADSVLKMENVAEISSKEFQKDNVSLTDKVEKYFSDNFGGKVTRQGFGDISVDRRSVKDSIAHGIGSLKAAAFMAVPEVLKRGKIVDYQENWKNRNYDTYVISAPIKIDSDDYLCEAVVTKGENRTGFYLHEVEIKEKAQSVFKTAINGTPQASRLILSQILEKVNANCSKIVDSNGEPLVVYHGSNNSFDEFSKKIKTGYFFSSNKSTALDYTQNNNVKACFLLASKKPIILDAEGNYFTDILNSNDVKNYVNNELQENFNSLTVSNFIVLCQNKKKLKDGIIFKNICDNNHNKNDIGTDYVVFKPNQIKSAENNNGKFDPKENSIKKSAFIHNGRLYIHKSWAEEIKRTLSKMQEA